jgi:hypothetical protein
VRTGRAVGWENTGDAPMIKPEDIPRHADIFVERFEQEIDEVLKANWSSEDPKPLVEYVLWPEGIRGVTGYHTGIMNRLKAAYEAHGWKVEEDPGNDMKPTATFFPSLTFTVKKE